MDVKTLAEMLNGCEYREEITQREEQLAKENGLVVVFGASDDLVEFRGAIDDEIGAWEGTDIFLDEKGIVKNECEEEHCPYFEEKLKSKAVKLEAIWGQDNYSWTFKTNIPHSTFEVMEGTDKYCKGIVFRLNDVKWF